MTEKTNEMLWEDYASQTDPQIKKQIKNELIERYLNLVKIISSRLYSFYAKKFDFDDLMGYGVLGLMDAIDRFDVAKNNKFETYATIRIRGSIMDQVRKQDFVPRSLRQKTKQIDTANDELENILGRTPTYEEIAKHMNIELEQLYEILGESAYSNVVYLEDDLIDAFQNKTINKTILDDRVDNLPEQSLIKKDSVEKLANAIDTLKENEKLIINLYYYENLTYKEIARIVDLSESRISQIVTKSLQKLRTIMQENKD